MSIVSSQVVEDRVQKDGRRAIRERHVDHLGNAYEFAWMAAAGASASAQLAGHASQLETDLAAAETDRNLGNAYDQIMPTIQHSTLVQFRNALRAAFQTATRWEVVRLGKFVNSLGLSDAQLINLFGVNAGAQLTALKAKLSSLAAKHDDVITQQGQ